MCQESEHGFSGSWIWVSQVLIKVPAGVVGSSEARALFQVHRVDGRIYVLATVDLMVFASSTLARVSVSDVLTIF